VEDYAQLHSLNKEQNAWGLCRVVPFCRQPLRRDSGGSNLSIVYRLWQFYTLVVLGKDHGWATKCHGQHGVHDEASTPASFPRLSLNHAVLVVDVTQVQAQSLGSPDGQSKDMPTSTDPLDVEVMAHEQQSLNRGEGAFVQAVKVAKPFGLDK
jgi:hypothetical protein